jgi:hypothetical protein
MLPARPNRLIIAWFDRWCRAALRRHFHRLHVYPETPGAWADFDPAVPRVYVANHSSFWDGIVFNHLVRRHRPQPLYCMIDERQVREHPFFRRVGGFSVDRTSPRDGLRAVRYAAELLRASPPPAIVVFPQGEIVPNDARPLAFESGVARLIEAAPAGTRVVPVALRYEFWLEQRAEALAGWGAERTYGGIDRRVVVAELASTITRQLDELKSHGLAARPGDVVPLRGKRSISNWKELLPGREAHPRRDGEG